MQSGINTTHTIKSANRCLVLDLMRKSEALTIEEIIHSTRLSRPTVLSILDGLLSDNVIRRVGFAEATVGRQPALYAIDTTHHFAIGIDFEFPPMHLSITDLSGAIRYSTRWSCPFGMDKTEVIDLLIANIGAALEALELTWENIIGIGLGIPGTVDMHRNMSGIISRINGWNETPLRTILSQYCDVPIYVRNDAHLLALAAQSSLPELDKDFLYIAYRTGIGMAIVRNGRLEEGCLGNSGYIGHTTMDINGDLCVCGKRGCLETFASKMAIVNKYHQAENCGPDVDFDRILALASEGDRTAVEILQTAGTYLGVALANCVKTLDISTIIVDDLHCASDHVFVRSICNAVNFYCSSYLQRPITMITDQKKEADSALGAALFVLNTFFREPRLRLSV